jgi:hypothetical protein
MTWSQPVGGPKGGKSFGKGKGNGQPHQQQGKGKGFTGYAKSHWQPGMQRQDNNWDKQLKDMERRLQSRDKQMQDLVKQLASNKYQALVSEVNSRDTPAKVKVSEVNSRDTPPKEMTPIPPNVLTTKDKHKPTMFNSKGLQVEVAWACACGQQHWSSKVRACVACKEASTVWTKVPEQPSKKVSTALGPFKNNKNLSWFQQMGLLVDEQASEEEGEAMDVEDDNLNVKRSKAAKILQDLQGMQADPELIRMAQAQHDAIPTPQLAKPSQEHWDMAKLQRIQAQLMDAHNAQKTSQQALLEELQTQAASLQAKVQAQQENMQAQQQQFDKYHQAVLNAVTYKQAGGPGASGAQPASQEPTPTQVTSSVLANQLRKAEASTEQMDAQALKFGVNSETLMGIMRFAYSGAVTGSAADDVAVTAAAAAAAANTNAAATPVPAEPVL